MRAGEGPVRALMRMACAANFTFGPIGAGGCPAGSAIATNNTCSRAAAELAAVAPIKYQFTENDTK